MAVAPTSTIIVSLFATGGSFVPVTFMLTVIGALLTFPSLALYVKESVDSLLPSWVYRKVPFALSVTVPLKGFVTFTAVIGSPSGSDHLLKLKLNHLK